MESETKPRSDLLKEDLESKLKGYNILIVEDEPSNMQLIRAYFKTLENDFLSIDYAFDGKVAQELINQNKYSLMILDLNIPHKSGIDLVQENIDKIKEEGSVTLAYTAHVLTHERRECMDAGFDFFMPKPLKKNKLYDFLEQAINVHEGRKQKNISSH